MLFFKNIIMKGAGLALLGSLLITTAHAQISMTYAYSANPNSTIAAQAFKSIVEARSANQIEVNLVIHNSLGGDRDVIDQLSLGEIEFYVPGFHSLAAKVPEVQIFGAPYLFRDRAEFFELFKDDEYVGYVRDWILARTNNSIRLLGASENSLRHLYSKNGPMRLPSDISTMRLRVPPTPLNLQVWDALNVGSVVGMSGSERNQAIQTGVIDAIEGSVAGAWRAGHMTTLDHVTLTGHVYSAMAYLINEDFYRKLSAEHQSIIREASRLSIWVHNGHSITEEQAALAEISAAGNTVTTPTPAEMQQWQDLAGPVGLQFIKDNVDSGFTERTFRALEETRTRINQ